MLFGLAALPVRSTAAQSALPVRAAGNPVATGVRELRASTNVN